MLMKSAVDWAVREINRNRSGRRCNQGSGKTSGMLRGESHDSQEQLLRYEAAAPETGH